MKRVLALVPLVLILLSCAPAEQAVAMKKKKKPAWAKSLPNLPSKPGYYQGLGVAEVSGNEMDARQAAEGEARAQIARAIRSEISSKVTDVMTETTTNGEGDYSESFESVTQTIAQETLDNLKVEFYVTGKKKKQKIYAYCAISETEVQRQFAERMNKAMNKARIYYDAATKAIAAGDYFTALSQYFEGAKEVILAELILRKPIEGDLDGTGSVSVKATFDTKLTALVGKLRVEISSGGGQRGVKGEPLPEPLVARLVYDNAGSLAPVKNASLVGAATSPTVVKMDQVSKTDGSGKAKFTVHSVESGNPSGVNKIRVGLDEKQFKAFAQHLPGAVQKASSVFSEFSFKSRGSAITKIVVLIYEKNVGREQNVSIIEGSIVKDLVSDQFKLIDKTEVYKAISKQKAMEAALSNHQIVADALKEVADILVIGNVEARESEGGSSNPYATGYQSNRKSAWAGGSVRCIDLESGKVIATAEKQGVKGMQLSLEKAGIVALQKFAEQATREIVDGLNQYLR